MAREVAAAAEVGARQAAEIPAVAFLVALGDPIAARVVGDAESAPVAVDGESSGAEIAARGEHRVELTAEQRAVGRGLRQRGEVDAVALLALFEHAVSTPRRTWGDGAGREVESAIGGTRQCPRQAEPLARRRAEVGAVAVLPPVPHAVTTRIRGSAELAAVGL